MIKPAHYFPIKNGRYEVKAGLASLDKHFGNPQDEFVFQIDEQWPTYFSEIQLSRSEDLEKYYLTKNLSDDQFFALATFMMNRLGEEHPDHFQVFKEKDGTFTVECHLDNSKAHFDKDFRLLACTSSGQQRPYVDLLDYLCSHLQEDVSLVHLDGEHDHVVALHLCLPNHWSAADKIGKCFAGAHVPVPGMEKINKSIATLSQQFLSKGPFTRFAWGLATDNRLNHHPEPPPNLSIDEWRGRQFDVADPRLFLRVERQVIVGLPKVSCYAFFIRTYHLAVATLSQSEISDLHAALSGMNSQALAYKGLAESKDNILTYLHSLTR